MILILNKIGVFCECREKRGKMTKMVLLNLKMTKLSIIDMTPGAFLKKDSAAWVI